MFTSSQEVNILVNSKPIKSFWHQNKWWVEAKNGTAYEIRIKNNSSKRVLAIVSVDGLDVLTGKAADSDASGYIIDGYSSYTVKGFRVSDEEVNRFEFADKEDSYAALSPNGEQSTANCGVIAVRFIEEKQKPRPIVYRKSIDEDIRPRRIVPSRPQPWEDQPSIWFSSEPEVKGVSKMHCLNLAPDMGEVPVAMACCDVTRGASFDMGTKFSEEAVEDKVVSATFERGNNLGEKTIYYASRRSLEAFGIQFEKKVEVAFPQAFKNEYCKPPLRKK